MCDIMGEDDLLLPQADPGTATALKNARIVTAAFQWIKNNMKPRRQSDPVARPVSALRAIQAISREHRRRGGGTLPTSALGKLAKAMTVNAIATSGLAAAAPQRKAPLTRAMLEAILTRSEGAPLFDGQRVEWQSPFGCCMRALLIALLYGGFRKDDLTGVRPGRGQGGQGHVPRLSVDDVKVDLEQQVVRIRVGTTKADPTGKNFAGQSIPLYRLDGATDPVAAFAQWLQARPPPPTGAQARRLVPFFSDESGQLLSRTRVEAFFQAAVRYSLGDDMVTRLSLHSARSGAATALAQSGVNVETIMKQLRWATEDSARVYMRATDDQYRASALTIYNYAGGESVADPNTRRLYPDLADLYEGGLDELRTTPELSGGTGGEAAGPDEQSPPGTPEDLEDVDQ